ncbi:MAG TPA: hypothetical protein VFV50_02710, partial [Bdellovibrionales bacterium]|nr:hypothetical protein [Bdellovibrionales bacterium]
PQDAATKNYVDTADAAFVKRDGSTPLTADWDIGGRKITNVANPTANSDVATRDYVNTVSGNYVPLSGGTMTGALVLPANGLTAGTNQLVISGGNVGIGTASPSASLHVVGTSVRIDGSGGGPWIQTYGAGDIQFGGSQNRYYRARNTTAAPADIQNNDQIHAFHFYGARGGVYQAGASIDIAADGDWGANDYPGRIVFSTTADGTNLVTERLRISNSGNVGIGVTNPTTKLQVDGAIAPSANLAHSLGTSSLRWGTGYFNGVNIGGGNGIYNPNGTPGGQLFFTGTNGTNGGMTVRVNDVEQLRVLNGAAGFGTNTPGAILDVNGGTGTSTTSSTINALGAAGTGNITVASTAGFPQSGTLIANNEAMSYTVVDGTTLNVSARGVLGTTGAVHGNGTEVYYIEAMVSKGTAAPHFVVSSRGHVGIGAAAPFRYNDWGTATPGLQLEGADPVIGLFDPGGQRWKLSSGSSGFHISGTTARFAILNNGATGIGTDTPLDRLHVEGQVRIDNDNDTTNKGCFRFDGATNRLQYSHDCATFADLGAAGSVPAVLTGITDVQNAGGGINLTPSAGNAVVINQNTASTQPTNGALVVNGGAGVQGALNVGGAITSNSSISATAATAATAVNNQSSPSIYLTSKYWDGGASQIDQWSLTNILGTGSNPTSTLTFAHPAGTSGVKSYSFQNGYVGIDNSAPAMNLTIGQYADSSGGGQVAVMSGYVAPGEAYTSVEHSFGRSYSAPVNSFVGGNDIVGAYHGAVYSATNSRHMYALIGQTRKRNYWDATRTPMANGDFLPGIGFAGQTSNDMTLGASIQAQVDGAVGANQLPSSIIFNTSAT